MNPKKVIRILEKNTKESYRFHVKNRRKLSKTEKEWFEALFCAISTYKRAGDIKEVEKILNKHTLEHEVLPNNKILNNIRKERNKNIATKLSEYLLEDTYRNERKTKGEQSDTV